MTIPATQQAAFDAIIASGRLGRAQQEVFTLLAARPLGLTRNELDRELGHGRPNASHSRRLAEMERRGVLSRGPARTCLVTGHRCETWIVTWQMPSAEKSVQKPKPTRALQQLSELLHSPRARVFPDATLEAAISIVDGLVGQSAESTA